MLQETVSNKKKR